jgi:Bacterial lipid A biosynthesis acyltransferase
MLISNPFYLSICTLACKFFSHIIAVLHYYNVRAGFLKIPLCIYNAPGGVYKNLRSIWFVRLFRRVVSILVRTPLRTKTLRLVDFMSLATDTGCVFVTCHTPWARLLMEWCLENDFALIIANIKSNQRANSIKKTGKGFIELRHLLRHLRSGGRIIIMVDVFNNLSNCSAKFLERDYNVSLFPARLAKIADVPLMAVVPELRNGTIHFCTGPRFDLKIVNSDSCTVMQNLLAFFEKEIRQNPSIWSPFVRESLSKN